MEKLWKDEFRQIEFEFEGRYATLIFPPEDVKTSHWMLKTEYFGAFPALEIQLLRRGYHLAYLKNVNRIGTDIDTDAKMRFAKYLREAYGLSAKCVPVGMSCAGLQAVGFAARYPDAVSVLYLDAPVMNSLSWPAGKGKAKCYEQRWKEYLEIYGLTEGEAFSYRNQPIDKTDALLKNKIPVILVAGCADTGVPYDENGLVFANIYRKGGGTIEVYEKPNCDHHPHSLEDPTPIAIFRLRYNK